MIFNKFKFWNKILKMESMKRIYKFKGVNLIKNKLILFCE